MLEPIDRTTEQELFKQIDEKKLRHHVNQFTGLERISGSDDEREASEYIIDTLSEYGIDSTLHEYEGYISVPEEAEIEVTTPTSKEIESVITVSFSASTPPTGIHANIEYIDDVDESVANSDLDGRIAFVQDTPSPHTVGLVERAGAEAVIFQSPNEHTYQGIVTPVWGTPSTDTAEDIPSIPVVETNAPNGEWLQAQLEHGPVEVTVRTKVTTQLETLPCPVGRIDGSESERYLVIGNHIDSWFEGITDNATAMATTLEIARIFANHDPKRGLIFGFWSAHSTGRYAGSAWYADTNWIDLRENGVAYLHIDLPGLRGAESLWYQHMAEVGEEHLNVMKSATDMDLRDEEQSYLGATGRPARNSDQSFWGAGLASLLSGGRLTPGSDEGGPVGGGWWWHTPADTQDKVDFNVLLQETRLYLALAARICESPVLPHDYRATVKDIREAVTEIGNAADGTTSFNQVHKDLDSLESTLEKVYKNIDECETDTAVTTAVEDLQVKLGNILNPGLYMEVPEYKHEPRRPYRQIPYLRIAEDLPSLTGRERRFAKTKVQRGRTKLRHRIREANRISKAFLAKRSG